MPIYQYPHESLVDTVHVLSNDKGGLRAYLYADNGADSENLRKLKQSLRAKGYECVPTLFNERPVLEVRGFKKPDELMDFLGAQHALTGKPQVTAAEGDVLSRKQKLQHSTLKMAGISYNIGDVAFMHYTWGLIKLAAEAAKKDIKNPSIKLGFADIVKGLGVADIFAITTGVGYAAGSYCLTLFGSKDQSINTITDATSKIERFACKEGYQIAPESSIAFVNTKPETNTFGNIKHFIGRYPTESLNAIYVGVGACLSAESLFKAIRPIEMSKEFKALEALKLSSSVEAKTLTDAGKTLALNDAKTDLKKAMNVQKWDRIDVGLGLITATSAITGLAVKERKPMEGDPKRHGIGSVVDWIREKPLRATGIGYMIATCVHALATGLKWKDSSPQVRKYLKSRWVFIGANVFSEIMLAISSKGHGVGVKPDSSVDESIIATAAELVLRQPADKRETIISQLSGYIASPEVLAVKADKVEAMLRDNLTKLDQNPWTKHYVSSAAGEVLEVTSAGTAVPVSKAEALEVTKPEPAPQPKPTTTITSPHYVAKQQLMEHAVA